MEDNIQQEVVEDVVEDTQQDEQEQVEDVHTEDSTDNSNEQEQNESVEEKLYTQADIDALQAQIDELSQYKPKDKDEAQLRLEQVWQREVNATLKDEGLDAFAEFIHADVDDTEALSNQIKKLKEIVGTLELSNGYQPTNHKPADGYSIAKKNKDVASMIKNKLNL